MVLLLHFLHAIAQSPMPPSTSASIMCLFATTNVARRIRPLPRRLSLTTFFHSNSALPPPPSPLATSDFADATASAASSSVHEMRISSKQPPPNLLSRGRGGGGGGGGYDGYWVPRTRMQQKQLPQQQQQQQLLQKQRHQQQRRTFTSTRAFSSLPGRRYRYRTFDEGPYGFPGFGPRGGGWGQGAGGGGGGGGWTPAQWRRALIAGGVVGAGGFYVVHLERVPVRMALSVLRIILLENQWISLSHVCCLSSYIYTCTIPSYCWKR